MSRKWNIAKDIGGLVLNLGMLVAFAVSGLSGNVALTILFGGYVLLDEMKRQTDRIVAAVNDDKAGVALLNALRRQPRPRSFRDGGAA